MSGVLGLVHRDVKPANMLVDAGPGRSDHVYLSDFGLSKKTAVGSAGLTGTGQFLGTLDYVAPEQIQGRPTDGRTDQYSLACAAFELLTGAPPFQGGEAAAVIYAHLSEPPPPVGSRRAGLPSGLDPVLARALAKASADRYPSCQAFADALLQALSTAPPRPIASEEHELAPDYPPTQATPVSAPPSPGAAAGPAHLRHTPSRAPTAASGLAPEATQTALGPAPMPGRPVRKPDAGPAGAVRAGSPARDGAQRRPGNDRALRHVSDTSGKLTAEGGFPVRTQTARLSGAGTKRQGTLLLYPDKLVHVRSQAAIWGAGIGCIAIFLANQIGQDGYSILGGLAGAVGGRMIGHLVAKRQAAAKAAVARDGVTVIPLDSVTGLKAWRSTGISGRLGSGSLVVTTTGGAEYRFGVQSASWSADLTRTLAARGREVAANPQGTAVTPRPPA